MACMESDMLVWCAGLKETKTEKMRIDKIVSEGMDCEHPTLKSILDNRL